MPDIQLSDGEWKVMHVVWHRHPASVRDVRDALSGDTGWAYTTVKTMMDRLVDKGALSARMQGLTRLYAPAISRARARRLAARALLARAFDGALGPMMHGLVDSERLSDADRDELIRRLERRGGRGRR